MSWSAAANSSAAPSADRKSSCNRSILQTADSSAYTQRRIWLCGVSLAPCGISQCTIDVCMGQQMVCRPTGLTPGCSCLHLVLMRAVTLCSSTAACTGKLVALPLAKEQAYEQLWELQVLLKVELAGSEHALR